MPLTKDKLIRRIKNRLGEPKVRVELDKEQYEEAIHTSLNKYSEAFPKIISEEITLSDGISIYEISSTWEEIEGSNLIHNNLGNWEDYGTPVFNNKVGNDYREFKVDSTNEGIKIDSLTTDKGSKYFFTADVMNDSTSPIEIVVAIKNRTLQGQYEKVLTAPWRRTWNRVSFYYDEDVGGPLHTSIILHSGNYDYGTWKVKNVRFSKVYIGQIYGVMGFITKTDFLNLGLTFGEDVAWNIFGGWYGDARYRDYHGLGRLSVFTEDYVTTMGTLEHSKNTLRTVKVAYKYEEPNKIIVSPSPTFSEKAIVLAAVRRNVEDIRFEDEDWVFRYALAHCKVMLGEIRAKYGDIPSPMGPITINGTDLKNEGREDIVSLEEQLGRMSKGTLIDGHDPF